MAKIRGRYNLSFAVSMDMLERLDAQIPATSALLGVEECTRSDVARIIMTRGLEQAESAPPKKTRKPREDAAA